MTRRKVIVQALGAWVLSVGSAGACSSGQRSSAQPDDITAMSLADLVVRTRRRDLSPVEVTEAYLARIEQLNPDLNAYITVTADSAGARARELASGSVDADALLLLGAPVAHKDLFDTAGVRTTGGSRLYATRTPWRDAALVEWLHAAGVVMLGKTNTHELGGGVTTINPFYGTTRNPRDRRRVAGGSSGGSAAAVVAQMAAAATGSDTGGSVRIPAAFCGCVGFKPTHGLFPTRGLLGASPTFDHVGLLTRTVGDTWLIVEAVVETSPRTGPARPATKVGRTGVAGLRIGVPRRYFFEGLDEEVSRAVDGALTRLRAEGAELHDVVTPVDAGTMARVFDPIVVAEIHGTYLEAWRARPDAFSADFAGVFSVPPSSPAELAAAHRARRQFADATDALFETADLLAMPTVPMVAPLIDGPIDGARILRNTWPFNASHSPALTVPCQSPGALPVGLQLVGRRSGDRALLEAGMAIQSALG